MAKFRKAETTRLKNLIEKKRINVRTKGLSFERWVCARIKYVFPQVKRHLENQVQEAYGVDLDHTGHLRMQCKKGDSIVPTKNYKIYNEIKANGIKVVVMARDRQIPMAMLSLDDFIYILNELKNVDPNNEIFDQQ